MYVNNAWFSKNLYWIYWNEEHEHLLTFDSNLKWVQWMLNESCDWFSCNIIPLVNQNLSKQWKWTTFGHHLVAKDYQSIASFTCENTAMPNQFLCLPATNSYFLFHKHHFQEFQMQWAIAIGKEYLIAPFFPIPTCRKEAKEQKTTTAIVSGNSYCQQQTAQSLLSIIRKPALPRHRER